MQTFTKAPEKFPSYAKIKIFKIKNIYSKSTQQLQTAIKCFEIYDLNCPGVESVQIYQRFV